MGAKINRQRLLENLYTQGKIGWEDGEGLQRTAYGENFYSARSWFCDKMRSAGLTVSIDPVGNLFGRLCGKTDKTILLGSHLDSVKNGGIYDGSLGIVTALETISSLKENNIPLEHSVEVAAFTAEEGEPLGGTYGSRAFAGLLPENYRSEEAEKFGITEQSVKKAKGELSRYAAFLELHIEQGPFLERNNINIGIPSGIVGITRLRVEIIGSANHAGTTPMSERKDAMRTTSFFLHNWFEWMNTQEDMVCNVGVLNIAPGHVSVIPSNVTFVLEVRSVDSRKIDLACSFARQLAKKLTECKIVISLTGSKPPVLLDSKLINIIKNCCEARGLSSAIMPSGASHDSSPIAHVIPTGMIFVPSHQGISHAKEEFTSEEDIVRGAELMYDVVRELDNTLEPV